MLAPGIFGKTRTPKQASSHLLVVLQFAFLLLCCYPQGWRNTGPAWFLILCGAGAVLGIIVLCYNRPRNFSVYPEVRVDADLITDGPYRYIRHPMYSALIMMMLGIAGYNGSWLNYVAAAGVVAVVSVKAWREEKLLAQAFPDYAIYAAPLKRFIPGVY